MPELHFHLGPVQGFIGASRRTRDYWAGSFLLSRLTAQAIVKIPDNPDKIIKPALRNDPIYLATKSSGSGSPFLGTLANHFSATIPDGFNVDETCATPIRAKWKQLATAIWKMVFEDQNQAFAWASDKEKQRVKDIWDHQIGDETSAPFWEIYWVVLPDGTVHGEDWLDDRKACRASPQTNDFLAHMDTGNFCTMIHGWQEISGYMRHTERKQQNELWKKLRQRLVQIRYPKMQLGPDDCLDLRENERLSAPAMVKRLFPLLPKETLEHIIGWQPQVTGIIAQWHPKLPDTLINRFFKFIGKGEKGQGEADFEELLADHGKQHLVNWPSTSYIAAAHWIARVQREAPDLAQDLAAAIFNISIKYGLAEQHLWLRCIKESADKHPLGLVDGAMLYASTLESMKEKKAETTLKILKSIMPHEMKNGQAIGAPSPYYAILRMDGDHIGRMMTGEQAPQVMQALNNFNLAVRGNPNGTNDDKKMGMITARNGIVMFAGGDDLLALLPLEDVIPAALAVRDAFLPLFTEKTVGAATISGAISIVDRKTPFRWALEENMKLMELVAKGVNERNSLAFNLLLPGNEGFQWAVPWEAKHGDETIKPVYLLNDIITQTVTFVPALAGNSFYHRLRDQAAPWFEENERCSQADRMQRADETKLVKKDAELFPRLLHYLLHENGGEQADADFALKLFTLCRLFKRPDGDQMHEIEQDVIGSLPLLTTAPLKIVRIIARHWCKPHAPVTKHEPIKKEGEAA